MVETLDASGRVVQVQAPGVAPMTISYEPVPGRVQTVTQGDRSMRIDYDANGYPQVLTDPLGHTTVLTNDLLQRGRPGIVRPSGRC